MCSVLKSTLICKVRLSTLNCKVKFKIFLDVLFFCRRVSCWKLAYEQQQGCTSFAKRTLEDFLIMTFQFNNRYFYLTLVLLSVEVFIGLFVQDNWIRPYGGDFLVVILLYCFVKSFISSGHRRVAAGVFPFAYLTETMQ